MASPGLLLSAMTHRARRALDDRANRRAAARGAIGAPPERFLRHPPPRWIGSFARGQSMMEGRILLDTARIDVAPAAFWQASVPSAAFQDAMQGFDWVEDLAAVGTRAARERAQGWLLHWLRDTQGGRGPGWRADLAGRRLLRLATHGRFLVRRLPDADRSAVFDAIAGHITYLLYVWHAAPATLARLEALNGLAHAAYAIEGGERHFPAIRRGLGREAARAFDDDGSQPERNPELAAECLMRLIWSARILESAGQVPDDRHLDAIARATPVIRALRLGDGGLAAFNGGGHGRIAALDQALGASGIRGRSTDATAMGFARLSQGRATLILDAAPPPRGPASVRAHAGTLAFELSSGRRPLIVNGGPGQRFGADWARACRATAGHSTLAMDRTSSARIAAPGYVTDAFGEWLVEGPREVSLARASDATGAWLAASHDGYFATHGLVHERKLFINAEGTEVQGEDALKADGEEGRAIFARRFAQIARLGAPFAIHFHLHPDVATRSDGQGGLRLILPSGEDWHFRQSGAELAIEDSVWLDPAQPKPLPTRQIILKGRLKGHAASVSWNLSRALIGGMATRDLTADAGAGRGA
jgi:uncharacterized heparinase superfamily protein